MEKVYVQAVMELLATGSNIETVLGNLRTVMQARGHVKALPAVLRGVVQALEQVTDEHVATVRVARSSDTATLAEEIKSALTLLGVTTTYATVVDDNLIGGLVATYNYRQIDQSYRTQLSNLYQSITN